MANYGQSEDDLEDGEILEDGEVPEESEVENKNLEQDSTPANNNNNNSPTVITIPAKKPLLETPPTNPINAPDQVKSSQQISPNNAKFGPSNQFGQNASNVRSNDKKRKKKWKDEPDFKEKKSRKDELECPPTDNDDYDEDDFMCVRGASPSRDEFRGKSPPDDLFAPYDDYEDNDDDYQDTNGPSDFRGRDKNFRSSGPRGRSGRGGNNRGRGARGGREWRGAMGEREGNEGEDNNTICQYFMQGKCHRADLCPFSHDATPPRKMELCKFYLLECCAKKDKCLYMHSDFPCKYYHLGLQCLDWEAGECKFSHGELNEQHKNILLKHVEMAPKEILGDFPRIGRDAALAMIKNKDINNPIPSLFATSVPPPGMDNSRSQTPIPSDEESEFPPQQPPFQQQSFQQNQFQNQFQSNPFPQQNQFQQNQFPQQNQFQQNQFPPKNQFQQNPFSAQQNQFQSQQNQFQQQQRPWGQNSFPLFNPAQNSHFSDQNSPKKQSRFPDKPPAESAPKKSSRFSDKPPSRFSDKPPSRFSDKPPSRFSDKPSSKFSDKPSSKSDKLSRFSDCQNLPESKEVIDIDESKEDEDDIYRDMDGKEKRERDERREQRKREKEAHKAEKAKRKAEREARREAKKRKIEEKRRKRSDEDEESDENRDDKKKAKDRKHRKRRRDNSKSEEDGDREEDVVSNLPKAQRELYLRIKQREKETVTSLASNSAAEDSGADSEALAVEENWYSSDEENASLSSLVKTINQKAKPSPPAASNTKVPLLPTPTDIPNTPGYIESSAQSTSDFSVHASESNAATMINLPAINIPQDEVSRLLSTLQTSLPTPSSQPGNNQTFQTAPQSNVPLETNSNVIMGPNSNMPVGPKSNMSPGGMNFSGNNFPPMGPGAPPFPPGMPLPPPNMLPFQMPPLPPPPASSETKNLPVKRDPRLSRSSVPDAPRPLVESSLPSVLPSKASPDPMAILRDIDLRLPTLGGSSSGDVDLRSLIQAVPMHEACKEIDATLASHPPIIWKLTPLVNSTCNYAQIAPLVKHNPQDPRLDSSRIGRRRSSDDSSSPKVVPSKPSPTPSTAGVARDPRQGSARRVDPRMLPPDRRTSDSRSERDEFYNRGDNYSHLDSQYSERRENPSHSEDFFRGENPSSHRENLFHEENPSPNYPDRLSPREDLPGSAGAFRSDPRMKRSDLRTCDPRSGDPRSSEFRSGDSRSSDFRNSDPRSSEFRSSDPRYSDFRNSDPRSSDFRNSDPRSSEFRSGDSRSSDFRNSEPRSSEFRSSDPRYSDFQNSDPRSSDFRNSDPRSSDFRNSDPRSSDFRNSDSRSNDPRMGNLSGLPPSYSPQDSDLRSHLHRSTKYQDTDLRVTPSCTTPHRNN